jgi:cellulose synthase/poly-beta-1,6-N-acetylglucosamine synthase-like glycosyltransferase
MAKKAKRVFGVSVASFLATFVVFFIAIDFFIYPTLAFIAFYTFLMLQGAFSIYWMLYAWEDAETIEKNAAPKEYSNPLYSFSAILPARHEEQVIGDTIRAINAIDYPQHLKQIVVVCRNDDHATMKAVEDAIRAIGNPNNILVEFEGDPINKPHSLNVGVGYCSNDIVVIFDAEDQPHPNLYKMVNTKFSGEDVDVVQAGVQLTNFRSSWFATLNVLEYFFWFKSTLHFFSKMGIIPLGGNTVFFKKDAIYSVGGWDENCLTEDADIGIRLSARGAKIRVVYDEALATQEETPTDSGNFIKQRTRWHQGFIQIFFKGDWLKLPTLAQRLLAAYILILPEIQGALAIAVPISLIMALLGKLPVVLAMFTALPFILLMLQLLIYCIGLYEFTRAYKFSYPLYMPVKIFLTFFPFQFMLGISAIRAIGRFVGRQEAWEKTLHINAHRQQKAFETTSSV